VTSNLLSRFVRGECGQLIGGHEFAEQLVGVLPDLEGSTDPRQHGVCWACSVVPVAVMARSAG
jgi:hypothetical protein